jgi:hypothetical protein
MASVLASWRAPVHGLAAYSLFLVLVTRDGELNVGVPAQSAVLLLAGQRRPGAKEDRSKAKADDKSLHADSLQKSDPALGRARSSS